MACGNCNCGSSLCLATGPKGDKGDTGATGPAGSNATDVKGTMLNLDSTVMDLTLTGTYANVTGMTYTVPAQYNGETLYIRGSIIGSGQKEFGVVYSIAVDGVTASVEPTIKADETVAGADTFDADFSIGGTVSHSYTCATGEVITLQAKRTAAGVTAGQGNVTLGELFIQIV